MDNNLSSSAMNLAKNIESLRAKQGLTQGQLAKRADVPRSTLTYLESGESNPSLSNLLKVSAALQVSIEELLSPPRQNVRHFKKEEVRLELRSRGAVKIKKLLPDPIPGMEIDRMEFEPGAKLKGTPHIDRTKEYLYCQQGSVKVYIEGESYTVKQGEVLTFSGDRAHAYVALEKQRKTICFSVVALAPMNP